MIWGGDLEVLGTIPTAAVCRKNQGDVDKYSQSVNFKFFMSDELVISAESLACFVFPDGSIWSIIFRKLKS